MNNDALPLYKQVISDPRRIDPNDTRYDLLKTIPKKEIDHRDDTVFVYLTISDDKDYFITLVERISECVHYMDRHDDEEEESTFELQIQTFRYEGNRIIWLSGNVVYYK